MTFEKALNALKEGKKIRRKDWCDGFFITLTSNKCLVVNGRTSGLFLDDFSEDWWEEYKEPVLTESEKEYLSAVIKPFRDKVEYITKKSLVTISANERGTRTNTCVSEFISIRTKNEAGIPCTINLPYFSRGDMYMAMINDKNYTLWELGL